ncbi:MAG: hypothetical protein ACI9QC_000730 [Oceanicoccus sp.]|jgi:hypothetical protein
MTLTMLAAMFTPLYLKMVLDPKGSSKAFKGLMKNEETLLVLFFAMVTLSAVILSSTGLNFAWAWDSLLAWLGLIVFIKAVFMLVPGWIEMSTKKLKMNEKNFPIFGFLGLLMMLGLVYVDLKILV